jgi:excisionase family DNA binding protein
MPKSYLLLKIPEAGLRLGFGKDKMYDLIHAGLIRTCKIGKRLRIAEADLDDFVARNRDIMKGERKNNVPRLVAVEVDVK